MLRSEDVLDLGPLGTTFVIKKTSEETDGQSFEMEWHLEPHTGGTPVHTHPHASETYEVLDGELDLFVDGEWRTLRKGETLTVPAGEPHTFRNGSNRRTRVYNTHAPAMKFDAYFEALHRLTNSGVVKSTKMTPKVAMHMAVLMDSFPEEIRSVSPPSAIIKCLAFAGRKLGYDAVLREA